VQCFDGTCLNLQAHPDAQVDPGTAQMTLFGVTRLHQ
jgi:hypothetical protein